jgi:hypothetical protein
MQELVKLNVAGRPSAPAKFNRSVATSTGGFHLLTKSHLLRTYSFAKHGASLDSLAFAGDEAAE